jgi:hypothetical protein
MAIDYIKIDMTGTQATQAGLLKNYVNQLRAAYELGVHVKDIMMHNYDAGTSPPNFAPLEALFGVPAGKGQEIFDLVNGSVGSMEGKFQVDDAKEITERVG